MTTLEVLTRTYRRPQMLARNMASLEAQTCGDWVQTLLRDTFGRGIGWSYTNMAAYAPQLVGDYIWVLDDDDECIRPTLVAEIQAIVHRDPDVEVIFVRMDHGRLGVLPSVNWGKSPVEGDIGVSAYIVRRDRWQQYAPAFAPVYAGDYAFITAVYASTHHHVWHDVVASRVQRISHGQPE